MVCGHASCIVANTKHQTPYAVVSIFQSVLEGKLISHACHDGIWSHSYVGHACAMQINAFMLHTFLVIYLYWYYSLHHECLSWWPSWQGHALCTPPPSFHCCSILHAAPSGRASCNLLSMASWWMPCHECHAMGCDGIKSNYWEASPP